MRHLLTLAVLMTFFQNMDAQGLLNSETNRKLKQKPTDPKTGSKQWFYSDFISDTIYIKTKFDLGANFDLIKSSTKIVEGISSTEGGEMVRAHRVDGIQIGYSKFATGAAADAITNAGLPSYLDDLPTTLLNSEIIFKQGSRVVQKQLGAALLNAGDTDTNNRYFIPWPFAIGNGEKLEISIKPAPDAEKDTANEHYISVVLRTIALNA